MPTLAVILFLIVPGWFFNLHASPVQITETGSYGQNFDFLPTSGTANPWTNDVNLPGWYA